MVSVLGITSPVATLPPPPFVAGAEVGGRWGFLLCLTYSVSLAREVLGAVFENVYNMWLPPNAY
jgi:hypothetical protein